MFETFFVRVSCELLLEEEQFLIENRFNPELYVSSFCLNKIPDGEYQGLEAKIRKFPRHTIHAPFFDISPGGFDEDIRNLSFQKLDNLLNIADQWGTEVVVAHFNYDDVYYQDSFNRWLDNAAEFFRLLADKKRRPLIALENIAETNPDIVLKLMAKIGSERVIHCFDVGHHHVFGKISAQQWLDRLGDLDYIHFHFHDNFGDFDHHLPVGEGNISWEELKQTISNLPCRFSVTLEAHDKESLIQSVDNYRRIFLSSR